MAAPQVRETGLDKWVTDFTLTSPKPARGK
jgi:hypothetical protein